MKKLMMFAAAMTIAGGAYAAPCGMGPEVGDCSYGVWDLTLSGKTTVEDTKKEYIKTASLGLKGLLVFKNEMQQVGTGEYTDEIASIVTNRDDQDQIISVVTNFVEIMTDTECCVTGVDVFLVEKKSNKVLYWQDELLIKLSVFGKGLATDLSSKPKVKGKTVAVESDIAWKIGDPLEDGMPYSLQFVGWGKAKRTYKGGEVMVSDGNCGMRPDCLDEESFEPGNWSGYFTGTWADFTLGYDEEYPFSCDSITCVALYGGTWKSKYNKKLSGVSYADLPPYSLYSKLAKNAVLVDGADGETELID